ncbi:MAG: pilus assembly protein PilE, partial [Verrucomicrobia bacterium]
MQRHSGERAFTLIELMTVIAVVAILFGIAFPAYTSVMERARKTEAQNSEQQIVTAVNAYYTEYGKYPIPDGTTTDTIYGPGGTFTSDVL